MGILDLQQAMIEGRASSVELVRAYTARIRAYDKSGPSLNAILLLNPRALAQAAALDAERAERGPRGPLHGVPILLKDNIDTADLPTSAASFALVGTLPPDDAYVVQRLRQAGAVILGKTNLHELAIGITTVSSMGGQTRNPYDLLRNPGGSSGGTGVAISASFAAIGYGTDTCGSIRIPAAFGSLYALRTTKGLISTDGVIPLSHSQDVVGPMARNVTDLAIGLDAVAGPFAESTARPPVDSEVGFFFDALRADALRGTRIGVLSYYLYPVVYVDDVLPLFDDSGTLRTDQDLRQPWRVQREKAEQVATIMRQTLDVLRGQGAEIVELDAQLEPLLEGTDVTDFEFKFDFQDYLAATPTAPIDSLGDILERGLYHPSMEEQLHERNAVQSRSSEAYLAALARRQVARDAVLDLMNRENVDALAYPTMRREPALIALAQNGSTCHLSASTGFPALTIPAGLDGEGLPLGLELLGRPLEDARLVGFAYAFEQARVRGRVPPQTTPPL